MASLLREMAFERVVVLGAGLIGGSIGLARQERGLGETRFWGRSEERLKPAQAAGFFASADLGEAIKDCDLVVLATPVEFYQGLAIQLLQVGKEFLAPGCLVTDVGSVKGLVEERAGRLFRKNGLPFVGSHPMAGSEKGGFAEAHSDLFEKACCFVCSEEGEDVENENRLQKFWETLGCRVERATAEAHDEIVARVSHLPHILAAVGAAVSLRMEGEEAFGGGGLRDTTRVAGGNPEMWRGILSGNRDAVLAELNEATNELESIKKCLISGDSEGLEAWLKAAQEKRKRVNEAL